MDYLELIKRQNEISLMFGEALDANSIEENDFIKKVKQEVSEILINLIIENTRLEKTDEENIKEIIENFKVICNEILISNGIEELNDKFIKKIGRLAYEEKVLDEKNRGYNIIYIRLLINLLGEIEKICKPLKNNLPISKEKENTIYNNIFKKIEELKKLNFLEYLLDGYIINFEGLLKSKNETNNIIKRFNT